MWVLGVLVETRKGHSWWGWGEVGRQGLLKKATEDPSF